MAKTPTKPRATKKTAKGTASQAATPRKLKKPAYRSFRLHKRITADTLPGAFRLLWTALAILGKHWKLFLGIALLYGFLNAALVQGFHVASSVGETKSLLDQLFTGNWGKLASGFTIFAYLLGGSGSTQNAAAGIYQFILVLVVSLALIWTLRQTYVGHKVRVRDGFYQGMGPLVKFVLVLLVIGLQLIPMAVGLMLYSTVTTSGIAATGLEHALWGLLAFMFTILSLYMVSSSLFALYVVTLPDMSPVGALRSARQLVAYRRWSVLRKVVFLPVVLVVAAGVVVVPFILFATALAPWVFFALTIFLLPVAHSYMYALYRSMMA